jgi:hypothetical protein
MIFAFAVGVELNYRDTDIHVITSAECLGYGTMQLIILIDSCKQSHMEVEYNNLVKTNIYKLRTVNDFKVPKPTVTCIISKTHFAYFNHHLNLGIRIPKSHYTLRVWS